MRKAGRKVSVIGTTGLSSAYYEDHHSQLEWHRRWTAWKRIFITNMLGVTGKTGLDSVISVALAICDVK